MTLISTSEEVVDGGYNVNHNYDGTTSTEWTPRGPIVFTAGEASPPPSTTSSFSRVPSYDQQHFPGSMSNFYLASSSQTNPTHIPESSASNSNKQSSSTTETASKQLISVKDDKAFKQQQAKEHEQKFNKYLSCCEQLFKEFGNKDYHHEEIYLMPPQSSVRYPPHMIRAHQHHMMRQHPMAFTKHFGHQTSGYKPHLGYFRGHPIITMEKIDDENKDDKKESIADGHKIPVECKFEGELPQNVHHIMPAAYHSSHHVPMFHPPPPPSYLFKKKLALLGKKYLLG